MQPYRSFSGTIGGESSEVGRGTGLSPSQLRVLTLVLGRTRRADLGVDLLPLRARGPRLMATLKWLEQHEYLRKVATGHVVALLALPRLRSEKAVEILIAARTIYQVLREHYRRHQAAPLAVGAISERVGMAQTQVADVLCYMLHASWSSGQTISLHDVESTLNVGEETVSFRNFDDLIAREEWWRAERAGNPWAGVALATIDEVRTGMDDPASTEKIVPNDLERLVLHSRIEAVVRQLLMDGHYALAIQRACIVLEQMVQERAGRTDLSGAPLMRAVFGTSAPSLRFEPLSSDPRGGEQDGLMQLYTGAMLALRNPRAHAIVEDPLDRTLEVLGFISFLCHSLGRVVRMPLAAVSREPRGQGIPSSNT